jgi:hypothetical protein
MSDTRRVDLKVIKWDGSVHVCEGMTADQLRKAADELDAYANRHPMEFSR